MKQPVSESSITLLQAEEWKALSPVASTAGECEDGVENRTLTLQQFTCQIQDFLWWHGGCGPSTWFLSFHSTLFTHFLTIKREKRQRNESYIIKEENQEIRCGTGHLRLSMLRSYLNYTSWIFLRVKIYVSNLKPLKQKRESYKAVSGVKVHSFSLMTPQQRQLLLCKF